jgi:hypothetical protein
MGTNTMTTIRYGQRMVMLSGSSDLVPGERIEAFEDGRCQGAHARDTSE